MDKKCLVGPRARQDEVSLFQHLRRGDTWKLLVSSKGKLDLKVDHWFALDNCAGVWVHVCDDGCVGCNLGEEGSGEVWRTKIMFGNIPKRLESCFRRTLVHPRTKCYVL